MSQERELSILARPCEINLSPEQSHVSLFQVPYFVRLRSQIARTDERVHGLYYSFAYNIQKAIDFLGDNGHFVALRGGVLDEAASIQPFNSYLRDQVVLNHLLTTQGIGRCPWDFFEDGIACVLPTDQYYFLKTEKHRVVDFVLRSNQALFELLTHLLTFPQQNSVNANLAFGALYPRSLFSAFMPMQAMIQAVYDDSLLAANHPAVALSSERRCGHYQTNRGIPWCSQVKKAANDGSLQARLNIELVDIEELADEGTKTQPLRQLRISFLADLIGLNARTQQLEIRRDQTVAIATFTVFPEQIDQLPINYRGLGADIDQQMGPISYQDQSPHIEMPSYPETANFSETDLAVWQQLIVLGMKEGAATAPQAALAFIEAQYRLIRKCVCLGIPLDASFPFEKVAQINQFILDHWSQIPKNPIFCQIINRDLEVAKIVIALSSGVSTIDLFGSNLSNLLNRLNLLNIMGLVASYDSP